MILPGQEMRAHPLHFIWIVNCSSSMASNGKIQAMNNTIREALPQLRDVAKSNPNVQVLVHAVKFSSGASWHVRQPTPVEQFQWTDVKAGGASDVGSALKLVAEELETLPIPTHNQPPPTLVLVTDSKPTDDFEQGMKALMDHICGRKAARIAIGIGADVDYNMLKRFIGNDELEPLRADNAQDLTHYINWASDDYAISSSSTNKTLIRHSLHLLSLVQLV